MCLDFGPIKPTVRIAEKDITVFKALKESHHGIYHSPKIQGKKEPWTRGYHYTELKFDTKALMKGVFGDYEVHGHAFHSCKTEREAQRIADCSFCIDAKVHKFTIPAGARYYYREGYYASSDLIFPEN